MLYHKAIAKLTGKDIHYIFRSGLIESDAETEFYITECGKLVHFGYVALEQNEITCKECLKEIL